MPGSAEQKLKDYLERECPAISKIAWYVWLQIDSLGLNLEVPDACPNNSGSVTMLTWRSNQHYLECEISDDQVDFFYRDRLTGKVWGEDVPLGKTFSIAVIDHLKLCGVASA